MGLGVLMHVMVRWLALAFAPAFLVAQQDSTRAADIFAAASEAKLDSLYGPLIHLMRADERGRGLPMAPLPRIPTREPHLDRHARPERGLRRQAASGGR